MTITLVPMTPAAQKATSPVKVTKSTKAATTALAKRGDAKINEIISKAVGAKPDAKTTKLTDAKTPAAKTKAPGIITTVQLAAEHKLDAKTLRARIRRNIAKWEPLFAGEKHTFKDNATTRKAIDVLLATA